MAELTEQQGHLQSILSQQKELANEINQLNAQLTTKKELFNKTQGCLLYTSPSPRDTTASRMPSSA